MSNAAPAQRSSFDRVTFHRQRAAAHGAAPQVADPVAGPDFTSTPTLNGAGAIGVTVLEPTAMPTGATLYVYGITGGSAALAPTADASEPSYQLIGSQVVDPNAPSCSFQTGGVGYSGFMAFLSTATLPQSFLLSDLATPGSALDSCASAIGNPTIAASDMSAIYSAAKVYAAKNQDLLARLYAKDAALDSGSVMASLEAAGFPTDCVSPEVADIVFATLSAYANSDDPDVRAAVTGATPTACLVCRVAIAIAIAVVVLAICTAIMYFAAPLIGLGPVFAASSGAVAQAAIAASSAPIIAIGLGSSALFVNAAAMAIAAAGVLLEQLVQYLAADIPRMICEAIGACAPALGTWTDSAPITVGAATPTAFLAPSLTAFDGDLYAVYKISPGGALQVLKYTIQTATWSVVPISFVAQPSSSPSIGSAQGLLAICLRDPDGVALRITAYDPATGVKTDSGRLTLDAAPAFSPSICGFVPGDAGGNALFLVYSDATGKVYWASYDLRAQKLLTPAAQIPGINSPYAAGLAAFGGNLYCITTAADGTNYASVGTPSASGLTWTTTEALGQSCEAPAAATIGEYFIAMYRGKYLRDVHQSYIKVQEDGTLGPWLGDARISSGTSSLYGPAIAVQIAPVPASVDAADGGEPSPVLYLLATDKSSSKLVFCYATGIS